MNRRLLGLKLYQWIVAATGLVLLGWLGLSMFPRGSSEPGTVEAAPDRPASIVMDVRGMYCASCERNVERSLGDLEGVEAVAVDLTREEVKIWTDASIDLADQTLEETVTEAGYEPGGIRRP